MHILLLSSTNLDVLAKCLKTGTAGRGGGRGDGTLPGHMPRIFADILGAMPRIQWLVLWKGFPAFAPTWEPLENLSGCWASIARCNESREANERDNVEKCKRAKETQEEGRKKRQKSDSRIVVQSNPGARTNATSNLHTKSGFVRCTCLILPHLLPSATTTSPMGVGLIP